MTDDDDNLIPFPRGQFERDRNAMEATLEDFPVRSKRTLEKRPCSHRRHGGYVDTAARTVECRGCGVPLDPFELLGWIADNRERIVRQGQSLRQEVDHLAERLERLRKDETNAKSRIRSARKRRDDRDALIAAASIRNEHGVGIGIGGYREWATLNEDQREVVLDHVRRIVEAYAGALAASAAREATG